MATQSSSAVQTYPKFLLLGPPQSGKTSFLFKLINQDHNPCGILPLFFRYHHKRALSIDIWDCRDRHRYSLLPQMYLADSDVLLVFVNPSNSSWQDEFETYIENHFVPTFKNHQARGGSNYKDPYVVFVCTHSDLPYHNIEQLEIISKKYSNLCKQYTIPILSISSKNGDGVVDAVDTCLVGATVDDPIRDDHVDVDVEEKVIKNTTSDCQII